MNPIVSKTFFYLILANALAFFGWVARNYLVNWWVLEKTNSTTMVGLVAAAPTLTSMIAASFGGQLADKYSRKSIFLIIRCFSIVIFFLVALVIHYDFYAIIIVIVCFLAMGVQGGIEVAAARNLILDVATFKFLTVGNSILEFTNQILSTAGPPLIAIFFTSIENTMIFFTMPAVQILSTLFALLFFLSFKEDPADTDSNNKNKSLMDGVRYAYNYTNIRVLIILTCTMFFWGITQPLIPKIARDVLNSGSSGYAILLSCGAIGAMLGSIVLPLAPKIFRNSKAIFACITIYSISLILFAFSKSILISGVILALGGFAHLMWFTVIIIMLQTLPDKDHKGRVIGLFFTVIQLYGLGLIVGGFMGDSIGTTPTLIFAAISLVTVHLVCFAVSPKFRQLKS